MYKQAENGVTFDADCQSNSRFDPQGYSYYIYTRKKNQLTRQLEETHSRLQ